MAQLLVRELDQELVDALERRAASHGRSAEDEHREILLAALVGQLKQRSFKEYLASMPYFDDDDLLDVR